jgi:hypothetical protein
VLGCIVGIAFVLAIHAIGTTHARRCKRLPESTQGTI